MMIPVPNDKNLSIKQQEAIKKIADYIEETGSITFRLEENKKELYEKRLNAYPEERDEKGTEKE